MINKIEKNNAAFDIGTPLSVQLARQAAEQAIKEAEEAREKNEEDPAEAVIKAYNAMDKEMMRVMDEHIERVRRSNERNKEWYRKLALKKEIEKRLERQEEYFDEASQNAEYQRKMLQMKN